MHAKRKTREGGEPPTPSLVTMPTPLPNEIQCTAFETQDAIEREGLVASVVASHTKDPDSAFRGWLLDSSLVSAEILFNPRANRVVFGLAALVLIVNLDKASTSTFNDKF